MPSLSRRLPFLLLQCAPKKKKNLLGNLLPLADSAGQKWAFFTAPRSHLLIISHSAATHYNTNNNNNNSCCLSQAIVTPKKKKSGEKTTTTTTNFEKWASLRYVLPIGMLTFFPFRLCCQCYLHRHHHHHHHHRPHRRNGVARRIACE